MPEVTVRAAVAGDTSAREAIYHACVERVYRLMYRMVGPNDASDLTQQVFLQVFRKLDTFEGNSKFETWLYRLAVNEALQFRRKRKLPTVSLYDETMNHSVPTTSRNELRDLLQQALAQIDDDLRLVFLLREQEGLSYADIAEVLGISEGTVGSRLNRVRKELQGILNRLGWEQ
ncbi:sigma-70 family RNA polymerase sigma factor [Thermostilla marina]